MANSHAPYFSIKSSLTTQIKSHTNKDAAIKAAGNEGYIFDRMLDIQMIVAKSDDGQLVTDIPPSSEFNFKRKLLDSNILTSAY